MFLVPKILQRVPVSPNQIFPKNPNQSRNLQQLLTQKKEVCL